MCPCGQHAHQSFYFILTFTLKFVIKVYGLFLQNSYRGSMLNIDAHTQTHVRTVSSAVVFVRHNVFQNTAGVPLRKLSTFSIQVCIGIYVVFLLCYFVF